MIDPDDSPEPDEDVSSTAGASNEPSESTAKDIQALGLLQAKWIEKQAEIAAEMGIESLDDFADLLQNMTLEEFRTLGMQKLQAVDELMASNLRISYIVAKLANRMIDAPTRLSATHVAAQEAILDRLVELAPDASVEELYSLAATYSGLPAPFTQGFYYPLAEQDVEDTLNEAGGDP